MTPLSLYVDMATTMKKVLNMIFGYTDGGTTRTVGVDSPVDNVEGEAVLNTMGEIIGLGTVCDSKGNLVDVAQSANITTTTVEELF